MDFFLVIVACFLPIILTVFFGILMIINVRNSRNRVVPQVENAYHERMRSNDRQLITMLLFQVLITILFTAPFTLLTTYSLITIVILKNKFSTLEQAIFSFASNLFLIFYYTTPVVGFYIYTLTGYRFRAEMKRCIQYALQSVLGQCSPLKTQRTLINENQMGVNNAFTRSDRREKVIGSIQHHKSRNMTPAV
jgi:signal transduction histidine kinase